MGGVMAFCRAWRSRGRWDRALDLAPDARVVGELRLAPLRVGQVQELDAQLDVPPAVLREQRRAGSSPPPQRVLLVGRPVGQAAAAQRHGEAVVEVGRQAAVHQDGRRQRDEAAVVEAGVHPAQVVVGVEPVVDLPARLEVDAVAPARRAAARRCRRRRRRPARSRGSGSRWRRRGRGGRTAACGRRARSPSALASGVAWPAVATPVPEASVAAERRRRCWRARRSSESPGRS